MKTVEFKIYPTLAQAQTIDLWLEKLKWLWNRGLELRLEAQQRRWREKYDTWISEFKPASASHAEGQQEAAQVASEDGYSSRSNAISSDRKFLAPQPRRWMEKVDRALPDSLKLKWKNGKIVGCGVRKTRDGHKYCEIRTCRDIENPRKFAQCEFFRSDRIPEWLRDIPTKFKAGVNDALDKAWKAYSDPKHPVRKPKFKGKYDKLKSLLNRNAGGKSKELKPERIPGSNNGYVHFPKLGKLYVKGLFKRFSLDCDYGAARIVKEPSGYYLQVCVPSVDIQLLPNNKAVGIDPGVSAIIATDQGRLVPNPRLLNQKQKRLRRLQRKLARQLKDGSNSKKTKRLIARTHEKIRRTRRAFNHKLSTKLVREYGAIAIEDTKLQNMTRRPKAVLREDGLGYEQNGASRKAGLNRSLLGAAIGDLRAKIETKAKAWGREVERTRAAHSSQNCHCCGDKGNRRSQSEFICTSPECKAYGLVQQADTNASRNHLLNSSFLISGKYRAWAWELMPLKGGETPSMQVEAGFPALASEDDVRSRGLGDENPLTAPLIPTNPDRDRSSSNLMNSQVGKKNKPEPEPEECLQLTLWDWLVEYDTDG